MDSNTIPHKWIMYWLMCDLLLGHPFLCYRYFKARDRGITALRVNPQRRKCPPDCRIWQPVPIVEEGKPLPLMLVEGKRSSQSHLWRRSVCYLSCRHRHCLLPKALLYERVTLTLVFISRISKFTLTMHHVFKKAEY